IVAEIAVNDPHDSLRNMRNPGVSIGPEDNPIAYALLNRGSGTYRLEIPKRELARLASLREVPCYLYHDMVEPWLPLIKTQIDLAGVAGGGWRAILDGLLSRSAPAQPPAPLVAMEIPRFARTQRHRNAELANHGLATPSGVRNTDGSQLLHAIRQREMDLISSARHAAELYQGELTRIAHERGLSFTSPLPPTLVSDRDLRSRIVGLEGVKRLSQAHAIPDESRSIGRAPVS